MIIDPYSRWLGGGDKPVGMTAPSQTRSSGMPSTANQPANIGGIEFMYQVALERNGHPSTLSRPLERLQDLPPDLELAPRPPSHRWHVAKFLRHDGQQWRADGLGIVPEPWVIYGHENLVSTWYQPPSRYKEEVQHPLLPSDTTGWSRHNIEFIGGIAETYEEAEAILTQAVNETGWENLIVANPLAQN